MTSSRQAPSPRPSWATSGRASSTRTQPPSRSRWSWRRRTCGSSPRSPRRSGQRSRRPRRTSPSFATPHATAARAPTSRPSPRSCGHAFARPPERPHLPKERAPDGGPATRTDHPRHHVQRNGGLTMADRILIKDAIVLSQDPQIGELPRADVLVEGNRITAVQPDISADGAEVIDAAGDIVIPGFIDTHRHTWETSIRSSAPDYTLGAYFSAILDKFAPNYRPDDVYAANQWGAIECINAGITTLVDWSHIMNTAEHADAAVKGLQDTGIRSVFAFGFPNTSIQAWWFGPDWSGSVERIAGDDARRIRKQYLSSDDALVTMALATRGPNFCKADVVRYEWELAKELGINITVHVAMDRFGYTKMQLLGLKDMDLLYPNTTYIHSSH